MTDCVERLKLLDGMGRVWGQDMVLEVRDGSLLMTDIETKVGTNICKHLNMLLTQLTGLVTVVHLDRQTGVQC